MQLRSRGTAGQRKLKSAPASRRWQRSRRHPPQLLGRVEGQPMGRFGGIYDWAGTPPQTKLPEQQAKVKAKPCLCCRARLPC